MYCLYFCNWSIYGRGFSPDLLPADQLTHIFYAFAKTSPENGTVSLSDPWADVEKPMRLGGKGCLGELQIIKRANRNLRVVMSIGGWTYSPDLTKAFSTPSGRQEFVRSAVELLKTHKLDGIDVDWEYPANPEQAEQYVEVLALLRQSLDALATSCGEAPDFFDLTVAAPAGSEQRAILNIPEMDKYLTFWNLMSYDFSGSWSPVVAHHANLFGDECSETVESAVNYYLSHGVKPAKLVMGMPLYGRSFASTKGLGQPFNGTLAGKYEQGVHDLKELPLANSTEKVDRQAVAAYCQTDEAFVTYDNAETLCLKAQYAKDAKLGGGMWWEASGDRQGQFSAVSAFISEFGPPAGRSNWI